MHKKLNIFLCSILMAASLFNPLTVYADEASTVESSEENTELVVESESQFNPELTQFDDNDLTSEYEYASESESDSTADDTVEPVSDPVEEESSDVVSIVIQDTEMESLIHDALIVNDAQLNGYEQQVLDRLDVISVCLIVLVALMIVYMAYRR